MPLDLSEEKKLPVKTHECFPGKYEAETQGCLVKFVNICKVRGCRMCAWRVHNARLQKRKNADTDIRIMELQQEKKELIRLKQERTKRFIWVSEELEEALEMKRPLKDKFADSDEDDAELVTKVEKPFRRERNYDMEKVRELFGLGPELPRINADPDTPRTDRKRYLEGTLKEGYDVLSEYQLLQISSNLEKLAWSKPAIADQGQLTYSDIENALSASSGKLTRRRCERVFEKLCIQQKVHAGWEKNEEVNPRLIRVDRRKDRVRLDSWNRAVEEGAVMTDYGIDTDEVVEFEYQINEKATLTHLQSLCMGVSLRPAVLRYDTAGSTLVCVKAQDKNRKADFFVFGECMLHEGVDEKFFNFKINAGDRVTFKIDRRTDPEGLFDLGTLSVKVNDGEFVSLIQNFLDVGLKIDQALFPIVYASMPPAEVSKIAQLNDLKRMNEEGAMISVLSEKDEAVLKA